MFTNSKKRFISRSKNRSISCSHQEISDDVVMISFFLTLRKEFHPQGKTKQPSFFFLFCLEVRKPNLTIVLKSDQLTCYLITARKRSLGQGNIFTPVCHSVHRGACVVALGGACVVALGSGGCMVAPRGCVWLLPGGACMVALEGHVWLLPGGCMVALGWYVVAPGGHAWLLPGGIHGCSQGGMCGCSRGVCMVALGGGHAWDTMTYGDTINERAVRILLECIFVTKHFSCKTLKPNTGPVVPRLSYSSLSPWQKLVQHFHLFCFQTLASILYKAAKEGSYADPKKVQEVLHISEEDLLIDERAGPENEDEMLGKLRCNSN